MATEISIESKGVLDASSKMHSSSAAFIVVDKFLVTQVDRTSNYQIKAWFKTYTDKDAYEKGYEVFAPADNAGDYKAIPKFVEFIQPYAELEKQGIVKIIRVYLNVYLKSIYGGIF